MIKILLILISVLYFHFNGYTQVYEKSGFSFTGSFELPEILNTQTAKGEDVTVYQNQKKNKYIYLYRVMVIDFSKNQMDIDEYYRSLYKNYSKLGITTRSTFNGKKCVQEIEPQTIYNIKFIQITSAVLHKGKSIAVVLLTNSPNYKILFESFKKKIKFL